MAFSPFITILGTGNALATRCFNTCFTLQSNGKVQLMVDAGGGNGILTQLEGAGIEKEEIQDLFVTHTHTDHLLGCVWMMRMALQFHYPLRIWSHRKVLDTLNYICHQVLPPKEVEDIGTLVILNCLGDEPYNPLCRKYVEGADLLLSEAFCLYEDRTLETRCERYTVEAASVFHGRFFVPDDLEQIEL